MLDSIKMKNVATYNKSGVHLKNLKKVNIIYGANGSGKTTISKLLDDLNNDSANPDFEHCILSWQNEIPVTPLVYNKDFRERNFKGNIDGVFTLGKATKDEIEEIEKKREELETMKTNGIGYRKSLEKLENRKEKEQLEFESEIWSDIYKKYKESFDEAFIGSKTKNKFFKRLLNEYDNNYLTNEDYGELNIKAKTIFGKKPETLQFIQKIDASYLFHIENDEIWKRKIVGKSDVKIAKLIDELEMADWVNDGRSYLREKSTVCPFCQEETIKDEFKQQLESYFDKEFKENNRKIKQNLEKYLRYSDKFKTELRNVEDKEKDNSETKLDTKEYAAALEIIVNQIGSNLELMKSKIKEPSRKIEITSLKEQFENITNLIDAANEDIKLHNKMVLNYEEEKSNLISAIWRFIVEENKARIEKFKKTTSDLDKGIESLNENLEKQGEDYSSLDRQIKEDSKNITSIQPAIDDINSTLGSYGFKNFEIVESDSQRGKYQIKREDGTLADSTLSEGEVTFITFLYFMQLAKGSIKEESINDERILVIDDPISSLDSNVLFVVSTLIKNLIPSIKSGSGNIKQLILFTHNVYFHKEISFIDGRTETDKDTFFWIIRKKYNVSEVEECEMENPINTSYELLWRELKVREKNSHITIQNVMRRIIENYFKILGKYGDDDLINKFTDKEEKSICRSFLSWINDGSHIIPDNLYVQDTEDTIDSYFAVFEKIFEYTGNKGHYEMMMNTEI